MKSEVGKEIKKEAREGGRKIRGNQGKERAAERGNVGCGSQKGKAESGPGARRTRAARWRKGGGGEKEGALKKKK